MKNGFFLFLCVKRSPVSIGLCKFDYIDYSISFYRNRESIDMIHHCSFEISGETHFYRTNSANSGSIDLQCKKYQQEFS